MENDQEPPVEDPTEENAEPEAVHSPPPEIQEGADA